MVLESALISLENIGFSTVLLPFFLVFVIVFAALLRLKIFDKHKASRVLIAFVAAFLFIASSYIYPSAFNPVEVLNESLPFVGLIVVVMIAALLVIGAFGTKIQIEKWEVGSWVFGLLIAFVINFAFPQINALIPIGTAFVIVTFLLINKSKTTSWGSIITFLALLAITLIFGRNLGLFQNLPAWAEDPSILWGVAIILIVGAFMKWGISEKDQEE